MRKRLKWIVPAAIVGIVLFTAIGGIVVMLLWNWLLPTLFGLRALTLWEAIGVLALSRILFGGFRLSGRSSHPWSRRRITERWEVMTPEERERFREGMLGRCGRCGRTWPSGPSGPASPLDPPPSV